MNTVSFQLEFRPELPNVYGTLDYREFRDTLIKIDEILTKSDLEHKLVTEALSQYVANNELNATKFYNSKEAAFHYKKLKHGAPRKRLPASSCKCCRENADPAYFVSSLGQIAVM